MRKSSVCLRVFVLWLFVPIGLQAWAQSTWNGSTDTDWSTGANWDAAPSDGDNLIFGSGFTSGTILTNDVLTSVGSITFNNSQPAGGITLSGNALTITGGIVNQNTTAGRDVVIHNNLLISGAQTISLGTDADAVTYLNGNLSGSGNITDVLTNNSNSSTLPSLRLGGSNSAYTGTITPNGGSSGLLLTSPAAMTGGLIDLNGGNRNLWLTGNSSINPYVFGTGNTAGSPNVNFRSAGTAGLYLTGGDVYWDPGNGSDYVWDSGSSSNIRLNGSNDSTPRMLFLGNDSSSLILQGNRTISSGGGGNNASRVTLRSALEDDASARTFTSSANLLVLTQDAVNTGTPSTTTVSGGSVAVSSMNQIFDGNLNLSGGAIILDNLTWTDFTGDRSSGYGTGANQWQVGSGGGFAARDASVTIDDTGTTSSTFDTSFAMGSSIRDDAGSLYANAGVILDRGVGNDTVALSAATDRTWIVRGGNQEGNNWTITDVVNEVAGKVTGGGVGRQWFLRGSGTNNSTSGGTLQISNAANDFQATVVIGGSNGGGLVAVFTDDGAFGNAANAVRVVDAGSGPDALLMFRDLSGVGKTFDRSFELAHTDASSAASGFGSFSGQVTHTGTATYTGTQGSSAVQVREGSLTLGTALNSAELTNNRTGSGGTLLNLRKGMEGELVLENVDFTGNFKWVLHGGTLVTTKDPATLGANPGGQLRTDGTQFSLNDILNGNNSTNNGTTWRVASESQTYSGLAGGSFGGNMTLQVDNGLTLRMDMASGAQLNSAEIGPNTTGFSWGLTKSGEGIWEYRTSANSLNTPGRLDGYIRVTQGTFDQQGSMGRTGIWVDGGTYLAGNSSQFTGTNRLRVNGGKIGISTDATANISRSTAFDGLNQIWDLGGTSTLTLASRGDFNLAMTMAFPTINNGERLVIERDGVGTGVVQLGSGSGLSINGTLDVRGELSTASVTVGSGGLIEGSGRINATLSGAGMVGPGSSPGILTAEAVDGTTGMDFAFEFAQVGPPTWGDATDSGNDVLRLTSATDPFVAALDADNTLRFYFAALGDYQGGFFTDRDADFTPDLGDATLEFFLATPGGSESYNGLDYVLLPETDVVWDVVQVVTAPFADGAVAGGWTMTFSVTIPEPGTFGLLALGLGGAALLRRRR